MFRTHCTKNALNDRRIWIYPTENYEIMRRAMLMRASLVPYIYTHARYAHDHGTPSPPFQISLNQVHTAAACNPVIG